MAKESARPIRPPLLSRLPRWLSRWLGYRDGPPPNPPRPYVLYLWPFIGSFCGLSVLEAIFGHADYFIDRGVPSIIASFGASAVLCYGNIDTPLAQPRALIGGHFLSALTGVIITSLFNLPNTAIPSSVSWLPPSLSTAIAIVLMQLTRTTHPPAGATALLPSVDPAVRRLGWYYLPVVLLSSVLVMATALLVNNVQRRWPLWWFEPAVVPPAAGTQGASVNVGHMSADKLGRSVGLGSEEPTGPAVGARDTSQEMSRSSDDLEAALGKGEGNGVAV